VRISNQRTETAGEHNNGVIVGSRAVERTAPGGGPPSEDTLVTGIGGVFFKAANPEVSREWYREHLGIAGDRPGVNFFWRERDNPELLGFTVWSVFPSDTDYFGSSEQTFMINYRVRDLDSLLARLKTQGVEQIGDIDEYPYGRFAWILDGEGNRVELWEPVYDAPEQLEQQSSN
jgi:predicted enzyme related to lactoylglutathione lyase